MALAFPLPFDDFPFCALAMKLNGVLLVDFFPVLVMVSDEGCDGMGVSNHADCFV